MTGDKGHHSFTSPFSGTKATDTAAKALLGLAVVSIGWLFVFAANPSSVGVLLFVAFAVTTVGYLLYLYTLYGKDPIVVEKTNKQGLLRQLSKELFEYQAQLDKTRKEEERLHKAKEKDLSGRLDLHRLRLSEFENRRARSKIKELAKNG